MKIAILLLVGIVAALALQDDNAKDFKNFMTKFNKVYESQTEMDKRFEIFIQNKIKAAEMTKKSATATYGITKFMDLTPEEFENQYLTYKPSEKKADLPKATLKADLAIPTTFDWRNKSAVTETKNQGQCGSCWAFSTTEAVESAWFLAGNELPTLAPQQIVDCDFNWHNDGNEGCGGGDTTTAYQYLMGVGGLEAESSYPYTAEDGTCNFNAKEVVATISNWTYITTTKNENEMMAGLVQYGPLSICVDAASWQYYIEGVVGDLCGDSLDHCVQVTGFGNYTDVFGTYNVWNVRNSWGADWGYDGYLYVERGFDYCGIADEVTWPLIK